MNYCHVYYAHCVAARLDNSVCHEYLLWSLILINKKKLLYQTEDMLIDTYMSIIYIIYMLNIYIYIIYMHNTYMNNIYIYIYIYIMFKYSVFVSDQRSIGA